MRDETKFTLWWISSDGQNGIFFGNFDSEAEAMAGLPAARKEFRRLCDADMVFIDFAARWEVDPPTEDTTELAKDGP